MVTEKAMHKQIIFRIEEAKNEEREFASQNPLKVGAKILLHYDAYYHASTVVVGITEKAVQVKGKPDGFSKKEYTTWFPKSALDLLASPCAGGEVFYSADIKSWFALNNYQERLLGTLE
jgi:hypothetical protein